MIGYLAPLAPDDAQRRLYRSYQCGLCHTLGAEYGFRYRLFAGPDMVFLNVFYDLVGAGPAPEGRRACVVAPVITRLPVRDRTEHTRFAAAFGVYMAVEKLRDDWEDERTPLKWLAWRAFRPGWVHARSVLVEHGFPVGEVEGWMRAQSEIERAGPLSLDEASVPTRAIARLLFGHAATVTGEAHRPGLEALGDRVGAFLFYVDNLLDLPGDLRQRGYNALARAFGLSAEPDRLPEAVVKTGLAGAHAQVDDLAGLVATLPVSTERAYLSRTLVSGFRDKLRRYERLTDAARRTATLKALLPAGPRAVDALRRATARPLAMLRFRAQLTAALAAMWLFPRATWAQDWWPDGADSAALDTGFSGEFDSGGEVDTSSGSDDCGNICDPCAGNFGWVSCTPCSGVCDGACSGVDCCNT